MEENIIGILLTFFFFTRAIVWERALSFSTLMYGPCSSLLSYKYKTKKKHFWQFWYLIWKKKNFLSVLSLCPFFPIMRSTHFPQFHSTPRPPPPPPEGFTRLGALKISVFSTLQGWYKRDISLELLGANSKVRMTKMVELFASIQPAFGKTRKLKFYVTKFICSLSCKQMFWSILKHLKPTC